MAYEANLSIINDNYFDLNEVFTYPHREDLATTRLVMKLSFLRGVNG